jgi:hypothetical protein
MDIREIGTLTDEYAKDRAVLAEAVRALDAEMEKARKKYMPTIKKTLARAAESKGALHAAIETHPELFKKPKTFFLHGIKIGFRKLKGKLSFADEGKVLSLIKKHFPGDAYEGLHLIRVKESVDRTALARLSVADCKRLGVTVSEDSDEVVIEPMDSEIEKLVDALLKGAEGTG